ncbi:MAG TPA: FeoA family protein [Polyangiaceae bacterium]|nr:FeoA family protein [Polyangiaceae bacterium]
MKLAQVTVGQSATIQSVGGERSFRRRLMELGLVPGTRVRVMGIAPLGDPLELLVRGASLSIRRSEAHAILVLAEASVPVVPARSLEPELPADAFGAPGPT